MDVAGVDLLTLMNLALSRTRFRNLSGLSLRQIAPVLKFSNIHKTKVISRCTRQSRKSTMLQSTVNCATSLQQVIGTGVSNRKQVCALSVCNERAHTPSKAKKERAHTQISVSHSREVDNRRTRLEKGLLTVLKCPAI
jgi:hypothetical protein